MMNKIEKNKR